MTTFINNPSTPIYGGDGIARQAQQYRQPQIRGPQQARQATQAQQYRMPQNGMAAANPNPATQAPMANWSPTLATITPTPQPVTTGRTGSPTRAAPPAAPDVVQRAPAPTAAFAQFTGARGPAIQASPRPAAQNRPSDGQLLQDWFAELGIETEGFRPVHGGNGLDASEGRIVVHLGDLRLVFHRRGDTLTPDPENPDRETIRERLEWEIEDRTERARQRAAAQAEAEAEAEAARRAEAEAAAREAAARPPAVVTGGIDPTCHAGGTCGTAATRFGGPPLPFPITGPAPTAGAPGAATSGTGSSPSTPSTGAADDEDQIIETEDELDAFIDQIEAEEAREAAGGAPSVATPSTGSTGATGSTGSNGTSSTGATGSTGSTGSNGTSSTGSTGSTPTAGDETTEAEEDAELDAFIERIEAEEAAQETAESGGADAATLLEEHQRLSTELETATQDPNVPAEEVRRMSDRLQEIEGTLRTTAAEQAGAAPAEQATNIEALLTADPNVASATVEQDDAGRTTRLTAQLQDGSSVVVDRAGTITRTQGDLTEVVDPASGRFTRTVNGETTLAFERREDGRTQVAVGDQVHVLDEGETPTISRGEDGEERIFILNARGVVTGGIQMDGVRILRDGRGAFVPGRDGQRASVVLNPEMLRTRGDIGLVELPRDLLSESQAALLEEGLAAMLEHNAIAEAAFRGGGEWADLPDSKARVVGMRLEGNRLQIDIESRFADGTADDPMRIVIDEDGTAYTLFGDLLIRDQKVDGDWTHRFRNQDNEWAAQVSLSRDEPSTFSMTMRALGEVAEVIFSPFQAALYGILGSIQYFGAGLYGDQAGLAEAWGLYTFHQTKFNDWIGQGLDTEEAQIRVYRDVVRNLTPEAREDFVAYLEGEVRAARAQDTAQQVFAPNAPITTRELALTAARLAGQKNVFTQYANMAQEYEAKGDTLGKWMAYGAGGLSVAGEAFLEGFGFGLATTPLKAWLASVKYGARFETLMANMGRGGDAVAHLTPRAQQALQAINNLAKVEMAVMLTPAAVGLFEAATRLVTSSQAGDRAGASRAEADLIKMLSMLAGFGLGMSRAVGAGRRWGRGRETAEPSKAGVGDQYTQGRYEVRDWDNGALVLSPERKLDHNGAFYDTKGGLRPLAMTPKQLEVNGVPLSRFDNVAVLQGHGSAFSISGMGVRPLAQMVANAVARANQRRAAGRQIEFVVLDSCSQGNCRFLLGETNAQAFQRALSAELASRGITDPVTVLASDRPGALYGAHHRVGIPGFRSRVDARFVPAAQQNPGLYLLDPQWGWVVGGGLVAAELGAAWYLTRPTPPTAPTGGAPTTGANGGAPAAGAANGASANGASANGAPAAPQDDASGR